MHAHHGKRTLILNGGVMSRQQLRRLQEKVVGVAAPCPRKPRYFYDQSYLDPAKTTLAGMVMKFREAFDAARDPEARYKVVDAITHLALELIAIARSWVPELRGTLGEVVQTAQKADAEEEMAESRYLSEPTPANRDRWVDAIRQQRATADVLEMHLLAIAQPQSAPLRRA